MLTENLFNFLTDWKAVELESFMAMSHCRIILGLFSSFIIIQLTPWMTHLTLDHAFNSECVDLQPLLQIVFTQV